MFFNCIRFKNISCNHRSVFQFSTNPSSTAHGSRMDETTLTFGRLSILPAQVESYQQWGQVIVVVMVQGSH